MFGKKLSYAYRKSKLIDIWKPSELLILIDLGCDYYVAKFSMVGSLNRALHEGPWFIAENFLSIKKWEPNFVPQNTSLTHTAIWVRLPHPPTEFYDRQILEQVGPKLGRRLKIDACISATLRVRYARICIQVPLEVPVQTEITIGSHIQEVVYEGEGIMCIGCGRIGHTSNKCTKTKQINTESHTPVNTKEEQSHEIWELVKFPKHKKKNPNPPNANGEARKPHRGKSSTQVRAYNPQSSMFLHTHPPTQSSGDIDLNGKIKIKSFLIHLLPIIIQTIKKG